jgi:hypothetical protein
MLITITVEVHLGEFSFYNAITFTLHYAEINVVAKRKNKVSEPKDIDHHVYAVLEQPSNQVALTNLNNLIRHIHSLT